jgi:putative DNA primase/helicase
LLLPEIFKTEICKGIDPQRAVKTLVNYGWIVPGKEKTQQLVRLPGDPKPKRAYVFNSNLWGAEL